jgi:hypothetical protein
MNWDDDREVARRIAEISLWSFDEALEALEAGGEAREAAFALLRRREEGWRIRRELREVSDDLRRRRRFGLLW